LGIITFRLERKTGTRSDLMRGSHAPGGLFPVSVDNLPTKLAGMPGITNYYASGYGDNQLINPNRSLCGELSVGRNDGDLTKYYTYVYAISDDGKVYINGPHKNFPLHHSPSASPITIEELFNHYPSFKNR
jgi:hypothetical protein